MGLTRKMMSLGTLGAVDFRSDKERVAAYARGTRKHTRRAAKAAQQQARAAQQSAPVPQSSPQGPPPGWYSDVQDQQWVRWWDGHRWTEHVQPRQ